MGATTNVTVEILFIYWLYDRVGGRFSVGFLASRELVGAVDIVVRNPAMWRDIKVGNFPSTPDSATNSP